MKIFFYFLLVMYRVLFCISLIKSGGMFLFLSLVLKFGVFFFVSFLRVKKIFGFFWNEIKLYVVSVNIYFF